MRLASFHAADGVRPAVVAGDELVDLAAADATLRAPWAELLERGPAVLERVRAIADSGSAPAAARERRVWRRRSGRASTSRSASTTPTTSPSPGSRRPST